MLTATCLVQEAQAERDVALAERDVALAERDDALEKVIHESRMDNDAATLIRTLKMSFFRAVFLSCLLHPD